MHHNVKTHPQACVRWIVGRVDSQFGDGTDARIVSIHFQERLIFSFLSHLSVLDGHCLNKHAEHLGRLSTPYPMPSRTAEAYRPVSSARRSPRAVIVTLKILGALVCVFDTMPVRYVVSPAQHSPILQRPSQSIPKSKQLWRMKVLTVTS